MNTPSFLLRTLLFQTPAQTPRQEEAHRILEAVANRLEKEEQTGLAICSRCIEPMEEANV